MILPRVPRSHPLPTTGRFARRSSVYLLCALALAGCSDSDPSVDPAADPITAEEQEPSVTNDGALRRLGDRQAFLSAVREALVAQRADDEAGYDEGDGLVDPMPDAADSGEVGSAPAAESDSGSASGSTSGSGAERGDVTSTNVQETGVDERDRVKTDGQRLFVLDSALNDDFFVPEPMIGGSIAIDGDEAIAPAAARTVLRVLDMDRQTPDAVPLADLEVDLDGRYADGFYLRSDTDTAIVTAMGNAGWESWGSSVAFRGQDSLIVRMDVGAEALASASLDGSAVYGTRLRIEGQAVASRRIGKHLFLATRFYPNVAGVSPWQTDAETWRTEVAQAPDNALLPGWTLDGGERHGLIDPADCFVAEPPGNQPYYSPDIVSLTLIDLDTMEPIDSECYLGTSETLYASPDSVYLATTRHEYAYGPVDESGSVVDAISIAAVSEQQFFQDPRVNTDIHRFDIGEGTLGYVGSGSVKGHLGWNPQRKPYRMSARDGLLRVATVASEQGPDTSPVILSVLEADGEGGLRRIAELPNEQRPAPIGKPGEQLYASRFTDDRAYLVTFRQTDPLYVIDLSDPRDPAALGELEITGYSDWLQPIGDRHLLGIGKDAVVAPDGFGDGRGGLQQGVKLSLFDVTDPRAPVEVQSVVIGERGTESGALYDARAITVQAATDTHPTRVAFGIDVHGDPSPDGSPSGREAWNRSSWSFSGLYGFDVRTGTDARIEQRGVMIAESSTGPDSYGPAQGQDRSVIAGDVVYYVHGKDVRVASWGEFDNASAPR